MSRGQTKMEQKLSERQQRAKRELDKILIGPRCGIPNYKQQYPRTFIQSNHGPINSNYDYGILRLRQEESEKQFSNFKKGFDYLKNNLSFVFLSDILTAICLLFAWSFSTISYATDIFLLLAGTCFMISTVSKSRLLKL